MHSSSSYLLGGDDPVAALVRDPAPRAEDGDGGAPGGDEGGVVSADRKALARSLACTLQEVVV